MVSVSFFEHRLLPDYTYGDYKLFPKPFTTCNAPEQLYGFIGTRVSVHAELRLVDNAR